MPWQLSTQPKQTISLASKLDLRSSQLSSSFASSPRRQPPPPPRPKSTPRERFHASRPNPLATAPTLAPPPPPAAMMKDKMKDFMKKVTSSGTPSSFKGTSHVLGSGPSPSSSHLVSRPTNPTTPNPRPAPNRRPSPTPPPASTTEFTPFAPLISSSSRRPDANGAPTVACPSCGDAFRSELAVSEHLDGCLASAGGARARAAAYLAADPSPPAAAVEVLKRLLGNLLRDPRSDKFRRVRLGNPRIKEAVADREGGVELLEAIGFRVGDEDGGLFAVMDEVPSDARLGGIRRAVLLLERAHPSAPTPQVEADAKESCSNGVNGHEEVRKTIDRQVSWCSVSYGLFLVCCFS